MPDATGPASPPSTVDLLRASARRGELHHALVLHGPSDEQLLSTAFALARSLNCRNGSGDDHCPSCQRIDRGAHPDIHRIAVAGERTMISVEQVRQLVAAASLRSYEGRWKIFIIERAEAMSAGAANAMLKTLEEPGDDTLFLLLTRSPDLLLPTIRSRAQSIPIRDDVRSSAMKVAEQESVPLQIARLRLLFPGLASRELERLRSAVVEGLHEMIGGNHAALLRVSAIYAESEQAAEMLSILAAVLRDLAALDADDLVDGEKIDGIRRALGPAVLLAAAEVALRGLEKVAVNADLRLLLDQTLAEVIKKTAPAT